MQWWVLVFFVSNVIIFFKVVNELMQSMEAFWKVLQIDLEKTGVEVLS